MDFSTPRCDPAPECGPPNNFATTLPASASWCEAEGTVTNSERRVQRVRKALEPPEGARDDIEIICEIARRIGHDWDYPSVEAVCLNNETNNAAS